MSGYSDRSEDTVFGWPAQPTMPDWTKTPCPQCGQVWRLAGHNHDCPYLVNPGIRDAVKILTGFTDEQLDELGGFTGEAR